MHVTSTSPDLALVTMPHSVQKLKGKVDFTAHANDNTYQDSLHMVTMQGVYTKGCKLACVAPE